MYKGGLELPILPHFSLISSRNGNNMVWKVGSSELPEPPLDPPLLSKLIQHCSCYDVSLFLNVVVFLLSVVKHKQ